MRLPVRDLIGQMQYVISRERDDAAAAAAPFELPDAATLDKAAFRRELERARVEMMRRSYQRRRMRCLFGL